jgi:general stress protein 26
MTSQADIEEKFWKSIKSDRTVMVGLSGGGAGGLSQPITAQLDEGHEQGPIYFFTSKDTEFAQDVGERHGAVLHFSGKGHDVFATVEGELIVDNDEATIDRLWNRYVAAWFEGGREDAKLQLLRFEPRDAQIWLNEHSLMAGVKLLMGRDPKAEFQDKVTETRLS